MCNVCRSMVNDQSGCSPRPLSCKDAQYILAKKRRSRSGHSCNRHMHIHSCSVHYYVLYIYTLQVQMMFVSTCPDVHPNHLNRKFTCCIHAPHCCSQALEQVVIQGQFHVYELSVRVGRWITGQTDTHPRCNVARTAGTTQNWDVTW